MNAINSINGSIGSMAMDGHNNTFFNTSVAKIQQDLAPASAAEVSEYLEANLHSVNETVKQLQELSDMFLGHTVKFNVNNELGRVIVEVVDSSTNRVIRQIPSEDLQKIQVNMKHTIGLLFDDVI
ncbi:MAG: flagellar protein FlaG [Treponema sp.]|nr:flagellar protein FlaG [Treponema sp.]